MIYNPDSFKRNKEYCKKELKTEKTHLEVLNIIHRIRKIHSDNHEYADANKLSLLGNNLSQQMEYSKGPSPYLKTDHWYEYSSKKKEKAKNCDLCKRPKDLLNHLGIALEVHHHHYKSLFNEKENDTTVWCRDCHSHMEVNYGLRSLRRETVQWHISQHLNQSPQGEEKDNIHKMKRNINE